MDAMEESDDTEVHAVVPGEPHRSATGPGVSPDPASATEGHDPEVATGALAPVPAPVPRGQLLGALSMLAGPLLLGWMGRDPLAGLPMLLAFVVIKAITRWDLWSDVIAERGRGVLPAMIAATVSVQAVVVTILFVLGRGLSLITGPWRPGSGIEAVDLTLAALVVAAALALPRSR